MARRIMATGLVILFWVVGCAFLFWNTDHVTAAIRGLETVEMCDLAKGGAPTCDWSIYAATCGDLANDCTANSRVGCNVGKSCVSCSNYWVEYSRCDNFAPPWNITSCNETVYQNYCGRIRLSPTCLWNDACFCYGSTGSVWYDQVTASGSNDCLP
jgi:hypothetical protein